MLSSEQSYDFSKMVSNGVCDTTSCLIIVKHLQSFSMTLGCIYLLIRYWYWLRHMYILPRTYVCILFRMYLFNLFLNVPHPSWRPFRLIKKKTGKYTVYRSVYLSLSHPVSPSVDLSLSLYLSISTGLSTGPSTCLSDAMLSVFQGSSTDVFSNSGSPNLCQQCRK